MKKFTHYVLTALLAVCFSQSLQAQEVVDRIVAIVGEEIILTSDVDNQYNYLIINGEKDDGSLHCRVMESLIVNKLLLNKAEQDSIEVTEDQVTGEVDRRVQFFLNQMKGNVAEFERIYGKSVSQFREDIKEDIKDELLVEQQRGILFRESTITPKEVKEFYESIPIDSLGLLPAEVQINHIVITPPFSEASEERAVNMLEKAIQEHNDGADFGALATKYTMEPGGKERKGSLSWFGRGQMVPEFEEVVYQMRVGDISEPFKTEFGYHVVKLNDKRGERVNASHILRRLSVSADGDSIAMDSLRKILDLISLDSMTFEQAAIRYSSDRYSKHCGGCISNPKTQELRIPLDALDADTYFKIDAMNEGDISEPVEYIQPDGSRVFRVIQLKNKIPPHKPNLKDDYQKIMKAALQAKQAEKFEEWLESAKKNIYIDIKPTECQNALKNWVE
ncbi:MAG: peptidylprolyl isomerase [Bacteroidota bacterium]